MPYKATWTPGTAYRPKVQKKELPVQREVASYIRKNYPGVVFLSDLSGHPMSKHQADENALIQSKWKIPDMIIFAPSADGRYVGFAMELKAPDVNIIVTRGKNKGRLANDHMREQAHTMKHMIEDYRWYCNFYNNARTAINDFEKYMGKFGDAF